MTAPMPNLTAIRSAHSQAKATRDAARKAGDVFALRNARAMLAAHAEILEESLRQQAEPLLAQRAPLAAKRAPLIGKLRANQSLEPDELAAFNVLGRQIEAINLQLQPIYLEIVRARESVGVDPFIFSLNG